MRSSSLFAEDRSQALPRIPRDSFSSEREKPAGTRNGRKRAKRNREIKADALISRLVDTQSVSGWLSVRDAEATPEQEANPSSGDRHHHHHQSHHRRREADVGELR